MKSYLEIIGEYYPGTSCYTTDDPNVYDSIIWDDTPIAQAELDAAILDDYKKAKIAEFSGLARNEIIAGFASSALGSVHWYDSDETDQLNLIGAVTAGTDMMYSCRVGNASAPKEYKQHTHAQLLTVINDGKDIKLGILQNFNTKKGQILAAADKAAVDTITW